MAVKTTKTTAKASTSTVNKANNSNNNNGSNRAITHDMIAQRAYMIYKSGRGGSELDNWQQAERELRNGK